MKKLETQFLLALLFEIVFLVSIVVCSFGIVYGIGEGGSFFLYLLECTLRILVGAASSTMLTTGEMMTSNDVLVWCICVLILQFLVCEVIVFKKYWRNKERLKSKWEYEKTTGKKKKVFTEKERRTSYISLGVSLLILIIGIVLFLIEPEGLIGQEARFTGGMATYVSIMVPLWSYVWRKLEV